MQIFACNFVSRYHQPGRGGHSKKMLKWVEILKKNSISMSLTVNGESSEILV